jgi:hypothetical protein
MSNDKQNNIRKFNKIMSNFIIYLFHLVHLFEPDHRERTYSSGDEKPFFLTEIDDYKYHEVLFIVCADSLILTNLSEILIST